MVGQEFLGTGMKFPPQIDKATGRFQVVDGGTSVKESIYIILMTQRSERWLHPEFGSKIMTYTFMDTSATRLNMMARELKQTILDQEPRVADAEIRMEPRLDKGCLIVHIDYTLAADYTEGSMVFPFYLYAETEGEENGSME
ncbi:MAG: GPW/gp25 family protein [Lachnospiraceae bacterium]|nr:GPW/gp25 family protein [Lachnospiraceae bacterium]